MIISNKFKLKVKLVGIDFYKNTDNVKRKVNLNLVKAYDITS